MLRHVDAYHVQRHLVDLISRYVKVEIDIAKPLATQGMDSLATMELRRDVQVSIIDVHSYCSTLTVELLS